MKIPRLVLPLWGKVLAAAVALWVGSLVAVSLIRLGIAWLVWLPFVLWQWQSRWVEAQLDRFMPQPPPEPTIVERVHILYSQYDLSLLTMVGPVVGGALASGACVLLAFYAMRRSVVRVVARMRGIQFEALRAGSTFYKREVPAYQVAVMEPGLLTDTHIGYGIRAGSYLVTPAHVVEQRDSILLSTKKAKVVVPVHLLRSRVVVDLAYIYINEKVWCGLGVSNAPLAKKYQSHFATAVGPEGASTGHLRKSAMKGMLVYDGSTVPGMSGAAYEIANQVVGVHTGVSGAHNIGVSSLVLLAELAQIVKVESSPEMQEQAARFFNDSLQKQIAAWNEEDLRRDASSYWTRDDWNNDVSIDYNAKLDFGESKPVAAKPSVSIPLDIFSDKVIKVQGQSPGADEKAYDVVSMDLVRTVHDHEERIKKLEEGAKPKAPKDISEYIQCEECVMKCRDLEAMQRHKANSHQPLVICACGKKVRGVEKMQEHLKACSYKPESALPNDTGKSGKVVKQAAFLGRRSNSLRRNKRQSSASLSPSNRSTRSPSQEANLSDVRESLSGIERLLKEVLLGTAGQSSAIQQK